MKVWEAWLAQARSDFRVFELLLQQDREHVEECHPLHYLQMATEKLAKAFDAARAGRPDESSHVAFMKFTNALERRDLARRLGWRDFKSFKALLRRIRPLCRQIEELHPDVGSPRSGGRKDGPNVEYPWRLPGADPQAWQAPAFYRFGIINRLHATQLKILLEKLFERFSTLIEAG
jgi:hypothetical protein